uniref:Uncharacterized protein n=1 Tax=Anopheles quadriannulatus TaxID=34691 RepID=A0A182XR59_ANOQN
MCHTTHHVFGGRPIHFCQHHRLQPRVR